MKKSPNKLKYAWTAITSNPGYSLVAVFVVIALLAALSGG